MQFAQPTLGRFHRSASLAIVLAAMTITGRVDAEIGLPAPEIRATAWLNSPPIAVAGAQGKVTLVEFWTFGCYNCRNVEPHVKDWYRKYAERGLQVIGVHAPETAYERDVDNVKHYLADHHIAYPVAVDGDFATWERYGTSAWPTWYLIDKHGVVRHVHVGEGAYAETEHEIEALLAEK